MDWGGRYVLLVTIVLVGVGGVASLFAVHKANSRAAAAIAELQGVQGADTPAPLVPDPQALVTCKLELDRVESQIEGRRWQHQQVAELHRELAAVRAELRELRGSGETVDSDPGRAIARLRAELARQKLQNRELGRRFERHMRDAHGTPARQPRGWCGTP